jgi:hypothetical protein
MIGTDVDFNMHPVISIRPGEEKYNLRLYAEGDKRDLPPIKLGDKTAHHLYDPVRGRTTINQWHFFLPICDTYGVDLANLTGFILLFNI